MNEIELNQRERDRAAELGVSEDEMRHYVAVRRAELARSVGLTPDEYAELEALADQARASRRGVSIKDWAATRDGRSPRR